MTDETPISDDHGTDTPQPTGDERPIPAADTAPAPPGRSRLRRVLNGLGILLLLLVVVPFVVYAVPGLVGADASFVVLSGSMEPAISAGDVVVVESVPSEAVAVDDVITYSRSQDAATVTHRVVDVDDTGDERVFYTKGDANEEADQRPVPASALVGAVVLTIPYIGYVIQFVGTTTGFALLVVLPFGALLLTEAVALLRRRRDDGAVPGQAPAEAPAPPADVAAATTQVGSTGGDQQPSAGARAPTRHSSGEAPGRHPVPADDATPSDDAAGVAISRTDMLLTLGVLVVVLPYVVFVAIELRTALAIGVAVGFGTAFALLAGVFVTAWLRERSGASPARQPTADPPPAASDGGTTPDGDADPVPEADP
ncbi:MAG: signal peptidase I [Halolamina sp.]